MSKWPFETKLISLSTPKVYLQKEHSHEIHAYEENIYLESTNTLYRILPLLSLRPKVLPRRMCVVPMREKEHILHKISRQSKLKCNRYRQSKLKCNRYIVNNFVKKQEEVI